MVRKEIIYVTKEDIQMPGLWVRDRSITCGSFGKCLRFPVTKKESFESLRLPLDKISCTRQFESKLSLRSFAKSLDKRRFFRKSPRPSFLIKRAALGNLKASFHCTHLHRFFPLKRAPPLISVFSPQGRRGKPPYSVLGTATL